MNSIFLGLILSSIGVSVNSQVNYGLRHSTLKTIKPYYVTDHQENRRYFGDGLNHSQVNKESKNIPEQTQVEKLDFETTTHETTTDFVTMTLKDLENDTSTESTTVMLLVNLENETKGFEDSFLKELEDCRKNYTFMNNKYFNIKLYGSLTRSKGAYTKDSFRCNFSEEISQKIPSMLSKIQIFKDIFILSHKNSSTSLQPTESFTESVTKHIKRRSIGDQWNIENSLELKLVDESVEHEPKSSHKSHIYIGSSLYPLFYEESRVLRTNQEQQISEINKKKDDVQEMVTKEVKSQVLPVTEKIYFLGQYPIYKRSSSEFEN